MKLNFNALVVLLATLFVLSSCGSGGNKQETTPLGSTVEEDISHLVSEDFPKPSEIPYLIMQTGADFHQSLINPRLNADKYTDPEVAALNLGVFAGDMGYLTSYEKTQDVIDYYAVCKRLADDLGILVGFDKAMVDSVDANIDNRDKLTALLDKSVDQATKFMGDGSKSKIGALIVTGSFVESLYLACGIVNTYGSGSVADKNQAMQILTPMISLILNQDKSVTEVSTMLGKVDQSARVTQLLQDWQGLEAAYAALAPLKEQIAQGKQGLTFNDQTLAGISKAVAKIRLDITQ